MFIANPS